MLAAQSQARSGLWSRFPPLTATIILINVAFFAATVASGGSEDSVVLALFGAKLSVLIEEGDYWRLVSHAFLHIGALHLLFNIYALYLLGSFVEKTYGARRTLIIYVCGAIGGGVASTLLSPALSAGASGAIFGLLGVTLWFGFRNRARLPPRSQRILFTWLLPFLVFSMALSFLSDVIDNWAHLGGLAGGLLAALPWGNPAEHKSPGRAGRWSATAGAILAGALVVVGLAFAVRSAAGGALWEGVPVQVVEDRSLSYRFELPAAWIQVPTPQAPLETQVTDRLSGLVTLTLQVRPASPVRNGVRERDALAELQPLLAASGGVVGGTQMVTLSGRPATRLEVDIATERSKVRRELYYLATRGRSFLLLLTARLAVLPAYRKVFDRIVRSFKLLAPSPLVEGWAMMAAKRFRAALTHLKDAARGPAPALALRALVRTHQELGDKARALVRARELAKVAPLDPSSQVLLIRALHDAGERAAALRLLGDFRLLASRDSRTLIGLAETAVAIGSIRAALGIYQEAITVRRDLYGAYNNYAWLLATAEDPKLRDPAKAVRLARVAVEGRRWKEPTFIDTLAEAQLAAGTPKQAAATAEKALRLSPRDSHLRAQLSRFRRAAGLPPLAKPAAVPAKRVVTPPEGRK